MRFEQLERVLVQRRWLSVFALQTTAICAFVFKRSPVPQPGDVVAAGAADDLRGRRRRRRCVAMGRYILLMRRRSGTGADAAERRRSGGTGHFDNVLDKGKTRIKFKKKVKKTKQA